VKRVLTSLERKAVFDSAGKTKIEFVICAIHCLKDNPVMNRDVDYVILCEDNNEIKKAEKELKKKFPYDEIRVLKNRIIRIK